MATVTIRNLDDNVVERLRARSRLNNRSLEAELRYLLTNAAPSMSKADFIETTRRIRAMSGRQQFSDSTPLIREDRDR